MLRSLVAWLLLGLLAAAPALAQCPMGPGVPCATHRQVTIPLTAALPPGWAFTRAGNTATYWNRGTLYTALANVPRFEFDVNGNAIGYENEPAATNLVLYSRDLTNGAWVPGAVSAALNAVGIDGVANSASTITASVTNSHIGQIISVSPSTTYTYSFWAKAESGATPGYAVLDFTYLAWIVSPTVYTPGTGVFSRISVTFTTGATTTSIQVYPVDGMGTIGTVIVDGNQLELGSFATSTIFTAGTAVTRNADNLTVSLELYPWLQVVRSYSFDVVFTLPSNVQTGAVYPISFSGSNGSNDSVIFDIIAGSLRLLRYVAGNVTVTSFRALLASAGNKNTLAVSVIPTKINFWINGNSDVLSSTSEALSMTTIGIGQGGWIPGTGVTAAHFQSLTLRAGPSTAAQLQAMR
jgi:hypothetical protein